MIQKGTKLKVADNTGAKVVECINVLGGTRRRYARIGDIITVSVKESIPHGMVKKKEILKALIVRQRKEIGRKNGSYIKFDDNAVVIIEGKEIKGTRIFGPVSREIRATGFTKILSLAPEVL